MNTLTDLYELTQKTWIFPKLDKEDPVFTKHYVVLCMVGEVGELANKLKKQYRGQSIEQAQINEEFADILYYYLRLAHLCGVNIEQSFIDKMNFNAKKYGQSNFTAKDQREVLEGKGDEERPQKEEEGEAGR